jgi:hypothetical protein
MRGCRRRAGLTFESSLGRAFCVFLAARAGGVAGSPARRGSVAQVPGVGGASTGRGALAAKQADSGRFWLCAAQLYSKGMARSVSAGGAHCWRASTGAGSAGLAGQCSRSLSSGAFAARILKSNTDSRCTTAHARVAHFTRPPRFADSAQPHHAQRPSAAQVDPVSFCKPRQRRQTQSQAAAQAPAVAERLVAPAAVLTSYHHVWPFLPET